MLVLDSVSCTDTFGEPGSPGGASALGFLQGGSNGGYFAVTSADVYCQMAYGRLGQLDWTDPVHVSPGNGIIPPGVLGIRFRNYVAGSVAVVSCGIASLVEPGLTLTSAGVSATAAPAVTTIRKMTPTTVSGSVAPTDLLGLIVAAGALGATGFLRGTIWGDWLNNTGGAVVTPRFQLSLNGIVVIDTSVTATTYNSDATRREWQGVFTIGPKNATNAQEEFLRMAITQGVQAVGASQAGFATGHGMTVGNSGNITWADGGNQSAIDFTAAVPVAFNVINGSAAAGYDTTLRGAILEIL